jgi:hypothetical protein
MGIAGSIIGAQKPQPSAGTHSRLLLVRAAGPGVWTLTASDLRVDTGHWRTGYLVIVSRELASFAEWMIVVNPQAAEAFADLVASAQADAAHLVPDTEG